MDEELLGKGDEGQFEKLDMALSPNNLSPDEIDRCGRPTLHGCHLILNYLITLLLVVD